MGTDYLCELAELSLKIANIVDRHGENGDYSFANEVGIGYRVLRQYLRQGVKAIIDIQEGYSNAQERMNLAEDFLQDIFGDKDVDLLTKEYKAKIREFVSGLLKDDDTE